MERMEFKTFNDANKILAYLQTAWNERHEDGEVFRYKLKNQQRKVLNEELGILMEVNVSS